MFCEVVLLIVERYGEGGEKFGKCWWMQLNRKMHLKREVACVCPLENWPPMHEEWKGNWMIMFFGFKLSIPIWPPPEPLQLWVCPHLHFLLWWIISTAYMCICDGRYGLRVSGHEQELAMLLPLCHLTRTIFTHLIACPLFSFFLFSFLY